MKLGLKFTEEGVLTIYSIRTQVYLYFTGGGMVVARFVRPEIERARFYQNDCLGSLRSASLTWL
jgi:hypothetical protein